MFDKKTNVLTVSAFMLLFSVMYLYNFMGFGFITGIDDGDVDTLIENCFENDELYVVFYGDFAPLSAMFADETYATSDSEEMSELPPILQSAMEQFDLGGYLWYNRESGSQSMKLELVEPASQYAFISFTALKEEGTTYFNLSPFLNQSYFVKDMSQESYGNAMDNIKTWVGKLDFTETDSTFTRHRCLDGKSVYVYEVHAALKYDGVKDESITFYVTPMKKIREIKLGEDERSFIISFTDGESQVSVKDFKDAVVYDSNRLVSEMQNYVEGMLE